MSVLREVFGNIGGRLAEKFGPGIAIAWWIFFSASMSIPIALALWMLDVPLDYSSVKTYMALVILWFMFHGH